MNFILNGISHEMGFRVFAFERVEADRTRTAFTVRADLGLIRRYEIPVQELPLLCRGLLERRADGGETRIFIFTEEEMRLIADGRATARNAAAQKRKPPRRPPSENLGNAWRGHVRTETAPVHVPPATRND